MTLCLGPAVSQVGAQSDESVLSAGLYARISMTALGYMRSPEKHFTGGKLNLLVLHSDARSSKTLASAKAVRVRFRNQLLSRATAVDR